MLKSAFSVVVLYQHSRASARAAMYYTASVFCREKLRRKIFVDSPALFRVEKARDGGVVRGDGSSSAEAAEIIRPNDGT